MHFNAKNITKGGKNRNILFKYLFTKSNANNI